MQIGRFFLFMTIVMKWMIKSMHNKWQFLSREQRWINIIIYDSGHNLKSRVIKTKAARTKVKVHSECSPSRWEAAIDNMKYE